MKTLKTAIITIILLSLFSCAKRDNGEILEGPALDALDFTIIWLSQGGRYNPSALSSNLKNRFFQRYPNGCKIKVIKDIELIRGFSNDGISDNVITIEITKGKEFELDVDGELKYNIKITEGELGIKKNEIYVKNGMRAQINKQWYIFSYGKWTKTN